MLKSVIAQLVAFVTLLVVFSVTDLHAQVNVNELTNALVGKTVAPTVEIGYQASTKNPVMINGSPVMFPAKTQIFPDGHEFFRIESGILHADADQYTTFKQEALFQITKVEVKNDCLEIEMPVSINSSIPDPKLKASVQFKFGKGWQSSMTTEAALSQIRKVLLDANAAPLEAPPVTRQATSRVPGA